MRIVDANSASVNQIWSAVETKVAQATVLEEAAQALATQMHQELSDSIAIARVFVTVPFGQLPEENRTFVRTLVSEAGGAGTLNEGTPVLSLIGTHGLEDDWNDRRKSKGHKGIPLLSASFVGEIPMISRLLKEMGVPLEWIDTHDSEILIETIGSAAGLFFVENAEAATDGRGRKIIAARDFVADYGIRGVFGLGGAYSNGQVVVIVAFCRDEFERRQAEEFLPLVTLFKRRTAQLAEAGHIFLNA